MEQHRSIVAYDNKIRDTQMYVAKKTGELHLIVKENSFLGNVLANYKKHYVAMVMEKRAQLKALKEVRKYLQDAAAAEDTLDDALKWSKKEDTSILKEIAHISRMLDDLVAEGGEV